MATTKLWEMAEMVGVATTEPAAVAAAAVGAEEARGVLAVAQYAAKIATNPEPTGGLAAALGGAPEGGATANEVVQRRTALPPPPARLPARTLATVR